MIRTHLARAALSLSLFALLPIAPASAGELRAGAAAVKITPDPATPMAGYYHLRLSEGVHDDLYAKAIVFEQDGAKVALVACDLIAMPRPIVDRVRQQIDAAGIPGLEGAGVMVSATHSHTGPVLLSGSSRDPSAGGGTDAVRKYADTLPGLIVQSVREADAKLAPARLSAGRGREEHLSFNRRFHMKDGTVGWNPGKLNPNIVKPVGPIDPDVHVVYLESTGEQPKPLATYVNFAMHLDTVGGLRVSADYPFTLSDLLARAKAPDMLTVFTIGTAGDINHIDVSSKRPQGGPPEAARIGTILAAEVLKTYEKLEPVTPTPPRVRTEVVPLALYEIKPGELEESRRVAVAFGKDKPSFMEKVKAFKVLDVAAREGTPLEAEVQVIALGDDVAWVSLPGEVFVELGMEIKRRSPFRHTIIAELANGTIGYIPTRRAYDEGNYEPISARCAAGSGEKLVEVALKLLTELKPAQGR